MPSAVSRRSDVTPHGDVLVERHPGAEFARRGLVRLCAAGFVAYCSYAICRTPLLPLLARDLGAGPMFQILAVIGVTMAVVFLVASRSTPLTDLPQATT